MKAAFVRAYGPPENVSIEQTSTPRLKSGQVLVRVRAAGVSMGDARVRSGTFPRGFGLPAKLALGIRGPRRKVLGIVLSGTVEAVAPDVTELAVGDEVSGMSGARMGAHAELAAVSAKKLVKKPETISHEDAAAALFGGTTALHFLRDRAQLRPGQTVLVNGAAGSVGSAAVQLAVHKGATVTAVTSAKNRALARSLGATEVIDYETHPIHQLTDRFDVVLDAVGNLDRRSGTRLLRENGKLLLVVADLVDTIMARGHVMAGNTPERPDDFSALLSLVEQSKLDPLTQTYAGLESLVEAYKLIDSGRKTGNVVLTL